MSQSKSPTKALKKRVVKAWAWVHTDSEMRKQPFISVDESKQTVSAEKRERFYGDPYNGKMPEAREAYNKTMRSLYRQSKIVPCEIHYQI